MAWTMKTKGASINDGGRKLKVGKNAYKIIGAEMAPVKSDETGREKQVVLELEDINDPSYTCKEYIAVMASDDTRRRIAEETMRAFIQAAGIDADTFGEKSLKKLVGVCVVIEVTSTTKGSGDDAKTYLNVRTVEPFDGGEEEESEEETEEEEESEEESEEEESEEEEEEEPEPGPKKKSTSKPAASKPAGKRPW